MANNRSLAQERRLFAIKGFWFDEYPGQDLKPSLLHMFPHSGAKVTNSDRIQGNVLHLFRYVYFFQRFYGNKRANVIRLAYQDLGLDDVSTWTKIFEVYINARQDHRPTGTVPNDATPTERSICDAADRIIALKSGNWVLTVQEQNDLMSLRAEWKTIIAKWKTMRSKDEPYLPDGDVLLMQLLEPPPTTAPLPAQTSNAAPPVPLPNNPVNNNPATNNPANNNLPQQPMAQPADLTNSHGPHPPAIPPSNHMNNNDNDNNAAPQLYNIFHPVVAQRFAFIFDEVLTNPHEGLQLLENVVHDPLVPMDMRKLCYDLGVRVSTKLQADHEAATLLEGFVTVVLRMLNQY